MLDPKALSEAVDLCANLGEGIRLEAIADTPLATLVRETPTLAMDENTSFAEAIERLVDLSRTDSHADLIGEVTRLASSGVRATLDISRNQVLPHLRKVITAHAQKLASASQPGVPYDIDAKYLPEVYKLPMGRDFALSFESTAAVPAHGPVTFGQFASEELIPLAKLTEDGEFNESMVELLCAKNGEGINQIQRVLTGVVTAEQIDPIYSLPLAIILKNLEMPQSGLAMTLSDYNAARAVASNAAGKIAMALVLKLDYQLANNALYGSMIADSDKVITVCGEVYRNFLEKGFTSEMLIANQLLGRKYHGLQLLTPEVMEELTQVYERDRAARAQAHTINLRQLSRTAVMDVLQADHKAIVESGSFIVEGDTGEKSWSRLKDVTDRIYGSMAADPEPSLAISAILCAVWYAHTDAWRFIDIMFDVEKHHSDLDADSIRVLATVQYIAEWIGSQFITQRVEVA